METRERLFEAAAAVFVELGLGGTSVEAICARAGFSRGAFYSNFSSREELFLALLGREYQMRTDLLIATMDRFREHRSLETEPMTRDEVARFIVDFFRSDNFDRSWFVLETEFLLVAIRERELAESYLRFASEYLGRLSRVITEIVAVAGWRFLLPAEESVELLVGVYTRALRTQALLGLEPGRVPDGVAEEITRVLFAITEVIPASGEAAPGSASFPPEGGAIESSPDGQRG